MTLEHAINLIKEHDIRSIDLKYSDLIGNWYHISFPARRLNMSWSTGSHLTDRASPG